ncbi:hypothetical protein, partial [uncultured Rikenella sp.]|uniref:hypothetical protein n=1 Tax=uncultured Rikenella sp. TaxID=368003 RepID=UPI002602E38E
VARWDFISILLVAKRVKSLFTRAGDGNEFCPRAGAIHSISAHAETVESPLLAAARVELRLASGRPGPACLRWAIG